MQPEHPLWRALFEALPYATYAFDAAGTCTLHRDRDARGDDAEPALGRRYEELTDARFDDELKHSIAETLADGAPRRRLHRIAGGGEGGDGGDRGDGRRGERHFDAILQPVEGGGCLLLLRDVSAEMRHERVLQDERKLFRSILDNDPSLIFLKDARGRFVLVNRAMAALYECEPDDLMEVSHTPARVSEDEIDGYARADREVLDSRTPLELEEAVTRSSGEVRWLRTRKCPLVRENGEVQVLGIAADITEERQSFLALKERVREAIEAADEREALVQELDARLAQIQEQHQEILDLSAPIIEVWEGVLAVPVIGKLTADRSGRLLDALLHAVSSRGAGHVILDLTGAGAVDVESADMLARMIRALALLGAEGILAGLRPELASAMVEHGIDLGAIATARNLRQALHRCIAARRRAAPVTPGAASAP